MCTINIFLKMLYSLENVITFHHILKNVCCKSNLFITWWFRDPVDTKLCVDVNTCSLALNIWYSTTEKHMHVLCFIWGKSSLCLWKHITYQFSIESSYPFVELVDNFGVTMLRRIVNAEGWEKYGRTLRSILGR
jgi:hypothetical protein